MSLKYIASCYLLTGTCIIISNNTEYVPSSNILKSYWNLLKIEDSLFPQTMFAFSPFLVPVFSIGLPILCAMDYFNSGIFNRPVHGDRRINFYDKKEKD